MSAAATPEDVKDVGPNEHQVRRRRNIYIALLVVVVVIGAVVAGFIVGGKTTTTELPPDKNDVETPAPTPEPAPKPVGFDEKYQELLPFVRRLFPDYTEQPETPIHSAHLWLVQDQLNSISLPRSMSYRFLLAYLYYSFWRDRRDDTAIETFDLLPGWLSLEGSECTWTYVSCDDTERMWELDLSHLFSPKNDDNNLVSIPSGIGLLTDLLSLNLRNNSFVGQVPTSLGYLVNLERLDLSDNPQLEGRFPFEEMSGVTNLRVLILNNAGTDLQTWFPRSIGQMTNLEYLSIANTNAAGGDLPTEIGRLTNLAGLNLKRSSMGGTLPTEIGMWSKLEILDMGHTTLHGSIPTEIGMWTDLKWLYLPQTEYITGALPSEIGRLGMLEHLVSDSAAFDGAIPAQLGRCTLLETLVLENTLLDGGLPWQLERLTSLEHLSFSDSLLLTGTIPFDFERFPNLSVFDVRGTFLSGSKDINVESLPSLECIDFYGTDVEINFVGGSCQTNNNPFVYVQRTSPCQCGVESNCDVFCWECSAEDLATVLESCHGPTEQAIAEETETEFFLAVY